MLKVAGGRCRFADVTIELNERAEGPMLARYPDDNPEALPLSNLEEGIAGASDILGRLGLAERFVPRIKVLVGTLSDTSDEACWLAGAMACLDALHESQGVSFEFKDDGWTIALSDGSLLRRGSGGG